MIKNMPIHVIDLAHVMTNEMPVFPGSDVVILKKTANVAENGYNELKFCISGHTGTHIDCGKHMFDDGFNTSSWPVERFTGQGIMIDCHEVQGTIDEIWLKRYGSKIIKGGFLLLQTGWDQYWESERYFRDFPTLTNGAAEYLKTFDLKGIGIDAPSFDPVDSKDLPVHHALLSSGIILIENLTKLKALSEIEFIFCCFPLKIESGDGSPVRAVAMINRA